MYHLGNSLDMERSRKINPIKQKSRLPLPGNDLLTTSEKKTKTKTYNTLTQEGTWGALLRRKGAAAATRPRGPILAQHTCVAMIYTGSVDALIQLLWRDISPHGNIW